MTFDGTADFYRDARPSYPEQLFEDLLAISRTPHGGRVLEVGAGTGQATEHLARRGLSIVALEPGPRLAEHTRTRISEWPNVSVVNSTFEAWPLERRSFHLVVSATAFHWVTPSIAYRKAAECLTDRGWIGLFWNRPVAGRLSARFYEEAAEIYGRWAPELAATFRLTTLEDVSADQYIEESGVFGPVTVRRCGWQEAYDALRYVTLLRTFSDHIALPADSRESLLDEIERLIRKSFNNELVLDRATILYADRFYGVRRHEYGLRPVRSHA